MIDKKNEGSASSPQDTATTQVHNNSESSEKQSCVVVGQTITAGSETEISLGNDYLPEQPYGPICSVFGAPVNNTSNYTNVGWCELFDKITGSPTILPDNSHKEKAENGAYYVRGFIDGTRKDENLGKCSLIILDVDKPIDGQPLPTPEEIHVVLKDVTHAVHSSATPGRSRIIFLVQTYDKEQTDELTYAAYRLCIERGLKFAFAGESKTKSQPWFTPQTTDIDLHQAYGTFEGEIFNPDMVEDLQPLPAKNLSEPKNVSDAHNPLRDFIEDLESGTIHEAAKKYAGWLRRTTDHSDKQIFDQLTVLIEAHCSDPDKVERWNKSEREGLEDWFVNNVDGHEKIEKFAPQDSPEDILQDFKVTDEYVNGLGKEEWLYPDLVIAGHILVIIAMSGGGKTTFLFNEVVPYIVRMGRKVFYVDADSPSSEHKTMKIHADKVGFTLINPTVNVGTGIDSFVRKLSAMVDSGVDLSGHVFIFDTLKKFTDLMNKSAVKDFFSLCRTMNSRGATCVFAAHANKYRDKEENLIPEGVGDVKNDADDLILFEREKKYNGINVTTVVDIDKGAKTRGIFNPFSFHIDKNREVTMYDKPLDLPDRSEKNPYKVTNDEILNMIEGWLCKVGIPICQTELVKKVHSELRGLAGERRIKNLLAINSCVRREGEKGLLRFEYFKGNRNTHMYSCPTES